MHIHFTELRYKNILSSGNAQTIIRLDSHDTNLIRGTNGAGKSTIIDALHFVLFGTAYRKINKPQLVNSVNGKDLLVEVDFVVGGVSYTIRRGIKPNVFDIIRDGVLLNKEDKTAATQTNLEKNVLGMDSTAFRQLVVIGSASYVPFMSLSTPKRREIIEELLDLRVIGDMASLHTKAVSQNKKDVLTTESKIREIQSRIKDANDYNSRMQNAEMQSKEVFEKEIEEARSLIPGQLERKAKLDDMAVKIEKATKARDQLNDQINQLKMKCIPIEQEISQIMRIANFFLHSDSCPTCKQKIGTDAKELGEVQKGLADEKQKTVDALKEEIHEVTKRLSEMPDVVTARNELNRRMNAINVEISRLENAIKTAERNIIETQKTFNYIPASEISQMVMNKNAAEEEYRKFILQRDAFGILSQAFKDDGVKALVIKRYIPIINELINHYLQVLDFFVEFELDETFNETIRSRHRDEFTFDSFSEGEKARISAAILLTWRNLSRRRNTVSSNLLIMDEVFDGAMDWAGTRGLMQIIQKESAETGLNIFVISHKVDGDLGDFDRTLVFEKVRNFSVLTERT